MATEKAPRELGPALYLIAGPQDAWNALFRNASQLTLLVFDTLRLSRFLSVIQEVDQLA